jgi:hypothetical protein
MDLTDRGGCMVAQILECCLIQKRVPGSGTRTGGTKTGKGNQKGGKDTRKNTAGVDTRQRPRERVSRYTPEVVANAFDDIFKELFPGEAVDQDACMNGDVEAQRPYPYQFADWRSVGITTRMVQTFCERKKIGLRVLYKNNVILKNEVESKGGDDSILVYQIFSDHAFFYDDGFAKHGAVQLATGPSQIQLKDDLAPRLQLNRDDDGVRVRYEDMERFRLEAFLEQVGEQISKMYWCYPKQIGEVQEQLKDAGVRLLGQPPRAGQGHLRLP